MVDEPQMGTDGHGLKCHIRWMIRRDMAEVFEIEGESFDYPWPEKDFIRCLRQQNSIGMVAEHEDRVVGFMIYELHKNSIRVLNFAVAADCRRRGVGNQMVAKLIRKLTPNNRTRIIIEVHERDLHAQLFFRSNGFRAVSVLSEYCENTWEDAYLMEYPFAGPAAGVSGRSNSLSQEVQR